jgi:hypothetical protein
MVRAVRAEAISLAAVPDTAVGRRAGRLAGVGGLVAVLLAALWLGPQWAQTIGDSVNSAGSPTATAALSAGPVPWLAGIQAALVPWWNALALWEYVVLGLGFAALLMLSAGPLDLPLAFQGGSVLLRPRSLRRAGPGPEFGPVLRSYLVLSTPIEVALDAGGGLLGLIPARLTAGSGREVRLAVQEFTADPERFIARRRAAAAQAAQTAVVPLIGPPMRIRSADDLPPIKLADGRLLSVLSGPGTTAPTIRCGSTATTSG